MRLSLPQGSSSALQDRSERLGRPGSAGHTPGDVCVRVRPAVPPLGLVCSTSVGHVCHLKSLTWNGDMLFVRVIGDFLCAGTWERSSRM